MDYKKYYPFELTEEQKELVDELLDFFESEEDNIFILKGYAGTGKTSIMLGLVKYLSEMKRPFYLMASTGRASKVLAEKALYPASTLHSSIYIMQIVEIPPHQRKNDDMMYRVGFKLKNSNHSSDTIFFVDESSMLSNAYQRGGNFVFGSGYLLDDFFRFKGPAKVVFIGDPAQLPPVNVKFSAALNKKFLESNFEPGVREFTLKKVMRYSPDSGMNYNTNHLREVITSKNFPPLSIKASGFDDMEVFNHENDLIKKYYETIKQSGVDNAIYITFTNKTTSFVNRKVRVHLWGPSKVNQLQINESLMVARNNYLYGLNNGDLITVDSIDSKVIKKAGLSFRKITIRVSDPDPAKGVIVKEVMIIDDLLYSDGRDLSMEQDMDILKNYFGRMSHLAKEIYETLVAIQHLEAEEQVEKINLLAHEKKVKLDAYSLSQKLPSKNKFIKKMAYDNMQTDPFLNALRVKFGYAITCHKAQGSEWENVFIHFEKSLSYLDRENLYRWTYTAISRAEKKLHLLNSSFIY